MADVQKKPVAMVRLLDEIGNPTGKEIPYLIPRHNESEYEGGVTVSVPVGDTYKMAVITDLTWDTEFSESKKKSLKSITCTAEFRATEAEKSGELISVDTLPTIKTRLEAEKAEIAKKIENYLSIVCTKDNIQAVKAARAELNNKFKEYEDQRKRLKTALSKQYDDFLVLYKENISIPLERAESCLKLSVDEYEDSVKLLKENDIRDYFADYLLNYSNIDFLTFERVGLNITKTANTETLKKQCVEFIDKVSDDLKMIALHPDQAEILVEYEASLNASQSITTIADKHARIAAQQAAISEREARQKAFEEANRVREEAQAQVEEYLKESPKTQSAPVAWVVFVNNDGEFRGREYSYLVPDDTDYSIGEILEIETKNGMTHGQVTKFGTIDDVPDNVVPFLKYLPQKIKDCAIAEEASDAIIEPIDDFAIPDFEPSDFEFEPFVPATEEPNERARATIRIAIEDSIERIDALLEMLGQLGYSYREIQER